MEWLNGLLDNRQFDLVGAPIVALALGSWLTYEFIRTRRAVKRGEPLHVWYLRHPVYPDDPFYSYFAFQREYPAIILFGIVGLIVLGMGGLIIWATFWPPHPQP
jgi:hypothetical protein